MQIIGDAESAHQSALSRSIIGSMIKPEGSILKPDRSSESKATNKVPSKNAGSPPHLSIHEKSQVENINNI